MGEKMTVVGTTVSIVPGVSILGVLSHLNYKPWYALAEFVDNSVQSHLAAPGGASTDLRVYIDLSSTPDGNAIHVRDNSTGIRLADFPRAFRPAAAPADRSGLSEFGMGMKSAACWFARQWSVRTTVEGHDQEHQVDFDVAEIVRSGADSLSVANRSVSFGSHYTEISLRDLYHFPVGKSVHKIKQHLTDIYRVLLRDSVLKLYFNGEELVHTAPDILRTPYYRDESHDAEAILWSKQIDFDFGEGLEVHGFAALRDVGSASNAGFSLFRRGRVIEGSGDDGYKPASIFGAGNSYESQRLFGELHLSGFEVSHTKDGFQWGDNEEAFLSLLKEELDVEPLPLLKQARGFRKLEANRNSLKAAKEAVDSTSKALVDNLPGALPMLLAEAAEEPKEPTQSDPLVARTLDFRHLGQDWRVDVSAHREESSRDFFTHSYEFEGGTQLRLSIRLNIAHPFVIRFGQRDSDGLEVMLRLAVAAVVAEVLARQSGLADSGRVTRNFGQVVDRVLSKASS
jgi:hypothetical protein